MKRRKNTIGAHPAKPSSRDRLVQPVLLFGLCKPGLVLVTVAYVLLAIAAIVAILFPHSLVNKGIALTAYILLAGLFSYKTYTVWCVKVSLREAARQRFLTTDELPPSDNGSVPPATPT